MNQRYTWALFLLFVALAAAAVYVSRTEPEPVEIGEGPPTATPQPLIDLAPAALQSVTAQTEDGSVTFTRGEDGWLVGDEPASDLVDGTLSGLASPNALRELPADRDPEDYGFASLSMTVTITTEEGNEYVIEVGDDTPVDPNAYVRMRGSDRLVVISNSEISQLRTWINDPPLAPTPTSEPDEPAAPEATEATEVDDATPVTPTEEAGDAP